MKLMSSDFRTGGGQANLWAVAVVTTQTSQPSQSWWRCPMVPNGRIGQGYFVFYS